MTVYFIGAGPGDPDLITIKGRRLIENCNYCLYAGSLVPEPVIACAPELSIVVDTAPLTLDEIIDLIVEANDKGEDIARVHSGDPSLYGAIAEQIRRLNALGIDYEIIPGVSAYAAAAAALGIELTVPEISQSVILTRTSMKSSPMPEGESLEAFAKTGATLAIHLSVRNLREIERVLSPYYGADCPVVIAYRVGWEDEQFIHSTLSKAKSAVMAAKITRTALILIGPALGDIKNFRDSALYDGDHVHVLRPKRRQ